MAKMVVNEYGVEIYFDAAVALMSDEIRERLAYEIVPCTEQEFFNAYCEAHKKEYGKEFECARSNPVY